MRDRRISLNYRDWGDGDFAGRDDGNGGSHFEPVGYSYTNCEYHGGDTGDGSGMGYDTGREDGNGVSDGG